MKLKFIRVIKELLSCERVSLAGNDHKKIPLNLAAQFRVGEIANLLLSHPEIDVNSADNNGMTPLQLAARNGNMQIVQNLLSHPNIVVDKDLNDSVCLNFMIIHITLLRSIIMMMLQ